MKKLMMTLMLMPMMALAATWYVNGSTGADSNSGTSESAPKATIQAAIDASSAGDTILVAPGTYAPIKTQNKILRIEGMHGPLVTKINGDGRTCADLQGEDSHFSTNTVFVGFTCYNGGVPGEGVGICCGTAERCIIRDCNGSGSGWGIVRDCLIVNNHGINGGGVIGSLAINCTMVGNTATGSGSGAYNSALRNCIVYGNSGGYDNNGEGIFNGTESPDELWKNLGYVGNKDNVYVGDPGFVDAANGDYRLAAGSPCIDAGDNSYVTTTADLAGNARIVNGKVDIGCYEYGSSSGVNITNGLVAYYPFDGNANDASGNGHSLNTSDSGVTLTEDRNSNANHAYYFDGTGTCYPNSMWKFEGSGTYSFWVKPEGNIGKFYSEGGDGYGQSPFIIFPLWGSGPAEGYSTSGIVGVGVSVGHNGIMVHEHAHRYLSTILSYQSELGFDWINVVVTIEDNGTPKLFLNGELVRTGITTEYRKAFGFSPQIPIGYEQLDGASGQDGVGGGCYGHFKGTLDDLLIYNRALSAAEVKALYDGTAVTPVTYTVTFDMNGADGAAPAGRSIAHGAAVGELPDVTRTGYSFDGWYTAASGGTKIMASMTVTGHVTYYAHWIVNQYTATFDANGGVGGTVKTQDYGTALAAPTVTREGYTFTGWSPVVSSTVPAADATYTAQWRINSYTMTFDAQGGAGGTTVTQDYGTALTAPTVTREGYTLTGWSPVVPTTVPAADATYTAQWRINSYTVTFDAQGGAGGGTVARNHGAALGELPVPTRDGFSFDGWFTAASGGAAVSAGTVITGTVTFYAHWTEVALYPTPVWYDENGEEIDWTRYYDGDEAAFAAESAATFDGYVLDGEEVCGIVQVKVAKVDRRSGTSRVSASLTLLGEAKKLSYKGTMSKRGVAVLTCSGKGDLSLCLGTNAMWGELGGKTISGARNVFAKAGDPKAAALSRWQGAYTLVLETVDASGAGADFAWGYSGLTVDIGAKGKVKIKGTMVDGAKVNVVSQLLVGDRRCCIPVVVPLYSKRGGFAFNLWLHDDGTIEAEGMGEWNATASKAPFVALFGEDVPMARAGAALPASLSFMLVGEPDINGMEVLYGFLPWEVQFSAGARWTMPASGSVKYDRAEDEYVDTKDSSNPAGLKLTYVSKTGAFKGSFKMYAVDSGGRLKKLTANVSGVMVGRHGYGRATVKGVGSWPVLIE